MRRSRREAARLGASGTRLLKELRGKVPKRDPFAIPDKIRGKPKKRRRRFLAPFSAGPNGRKKYARERKEAFSAFPPASLSSFRMEK